MAKSLISSLIIVLIYSSTCLAYVRDYSGLANNWESDKNKAYVSGKTLFDDGKTIINLFVISFEKEYECNPVFKISFLEGNEYGDFLNNTPIKEGFIKLYVDNEIVYDGPALEIIYTNVTEFGSPISEDILNKISSGNIIKIELVDMMDIKFNLNKSKQNIDKAREGCIKEQ